MNMTMTRKRRDRSRIASLFLSYSTAVKTDQQVTVFNAHSTMKVTSGSEINSEAKHFHTHTQNPQKLQDLHCRALIDSISRQDLAPLARELFFVFVFVLKWLYGPRFVSCRPVCLHSGTPYALRWHPVSREIKMKRCMKIQASSITSRSMTLLHECW